MTENNKLVVVSPVESAHTALKTFLDDEYPMINDTTEALEVKNPEQLAVAGDWRKKVSDELKLIEARRKAIVDPLNKEVKDVNAVFKIATGLFEGLITKLDSKMKPFMVEQQRAREEAAEIQRKKELAEREVLQKTVETAALNTGNAVLLDMAVGIEEDKNKFAAKDIKVSKTTKGEESSTTLKKRWFYRVMNESKVERRLLSVDDKKVKQYMSANDEALKAGKLTALGIEFYSDFDLTSR